MEKLPTRLQYFDGKRSSDAVLRRKLIDSLYQVVFGGLDRVGGERPRWVVWSCSSVVSMIGHERNGCNREIW